MPSIVGTHHGCSECRNQLYTKLTYAPDAMIYVCQRSLNMRHGCKCAAPNDMPSVCLCSHVDHPGGSCEIVEDDVVAAVEVVEAEEAIEGVMEDTIAGSLGLREPVFTETPRAVEATAEVVEENPAADPAPRKTRRRARQQGA